MIRSAEGTRSTRDLGSVCAATVAWTQRLLRALYARTAQNYLSLAGSKEKGISLFYEKEIGMKRPVLVFAFVAATGSLFGQQASQSNPYQGTANPPPDDTIITDTPSDQAPAAAQTPTLAKPPAGHPYTAATATAARSATPTTGQSPEVQPSNVQVSGALPPDLTTGPAAYDPDGDIVHPAPPAPGVVPEGTMIRVRLMNDLSSTFSEKGEPFRSRVASDVLAGSNVVIPAGSEISGQVVQATTGHFAGHGTLMLRPEKVTLPNGESFRLHAMVDSAPGTHTRVNNEGAISADSRKLRAGIEYGGAVGAGAVAGAYLGGPVGALAGSLIGAGLVTTHLLVSHPQAHLDSGDVLMLTVTEQMHLDPVSTSGS